MHSLSDRRRSPRRRHLLPLAILALGAVLAGWPTMALAEEVECNSIRLEMASEGYDLTCDTDSGSDMTFETLEANSSDGTHFLVIGDLVTSYRYIFPGGGSLRKNLTDAFGSLDVEDWRSGKSQQGLTTAEFASDYKTIPSACVGFQGYFHKERGGWRRYVIGFGCSRVGDRSQIYDALRHVEFPD